MVGTSLAKGCDDDATDVLTRSTWSAAVTGPEVVTRAIRVLFVATYAAIVFLFLAGGIYLVGLVVVEAWVGLRVAGVGLTSRFDTVLRSMGYLTIAVAALELGQTVLEEEVLRSTHVSGPTRARRFLSRFVVVVVVALAVESLIAVFQFAHEAPEHLPYAASIAVAAALLLAAWGVFVQLNLGAEALEPEGMAAAKHEDVEVTRKEGGGAVAPSDVTTQTGRDRDR